MVLYFAAVLSNHFRKNKPPSEATSFSLRQINIPTNDIITCKSLLSMGESRIFLMLSTLVCTPFVDGDTYSSM